VDCGCGKLPEFLNFSDGMAKRYSVELELHQKKEFLNYTKTTTEFPAEVFI